MLLCTLDPTFFMFDMAKQGATACLTLFQYSLSCCHHDRVGVGEMCWVVEEWGRGDREQSVGLHEVRRKVEAGVGSNPLEGYSYFHLLAHSVWHLQHPPAPTCEDTRLGRLGWTAASRVSYISRGLGM